jgi:histone acetyltransferase (RNA polymerase elongator complex component)
MKQIESYSGFEQGPIRPPSEADSLLIRITRNCPWNRCTFCSLYKGSTFSKRPLEHVLRDIDTIRLYADTIINAAGNGTTLSHQDLQQLTGGTHQPDLSAYHAASSFVANGMKSVFFQDGNSLIIAPADIIKILIHLKKAFPTLERITSYARSQTISKISDKDLQLMAAAGLNRIHIGMESGADQVLERVKKGVDKATHIIAGQKVKKAGIQLSEYFMPGLGGRDLSKEHAIETADALNQINPDFIRLRALALPSGAPLTAEYQNRDFAKMGEVETAQELLLWLENLGEINSAIRSDHVLNLFSEIDGQWPRDKDKMLQPVREFLQLAPPEQMLFCIGRRTHRFACLKDLSNPVRRANAEKLCASLGATPENYDQIIESIVQRFI